MAWGDIAAGLGGGLSGGLGMYQWQQEQKAKDKHDEMVNDLKRELAKMHGDQALEQINARSQGKQALQEMINSGKANVQDLIDHKDMTIAKWHEDGLITRDEMHALNNLDVADIKAAAARYSADTSKAASDYRADQGLKGVDLSSGRRLQGTLGAAEIGAGTAATAEQGRNWRFGQELPVKWGNVEANQARAATGANSYNLRPGTPTPQFTPFMQSWRQQQDKGVPYQGPVDPGMVQQPLLPPPPNYSPVSPNITAPSLGGTTSPPPQAAPQVAPQAPVVKPSALPQSRQAAPTTQPAPQAAPAPSTISPINQGAGRLPGGGPVAAAPAKAPSGKAAIVQQMNTLSTQLEQMQPGPQLEEGKRQLAILSAQLVAAK